MKVLCDIHHGDLYESLRILFEDRLGYSFYRPYGIDWWQEKYWKIVDAEDTARQYLEPAGTKNSLGDVVIVDHNHGGRVHRGMTLERIKAEGVDIIISSVPQHFPLFESLKQKFFPKAKHIFQVGNHGWPMPVGCKNILNSTTNEYPTCPNHVRYHQEFDLSEYSYQPPTETKTIVNLVHFQSHHYLNEWNQLKAVLEPKGWKFLNYGISNDLGPASDVAGAIKSAGFIWQMKKGHTEGYGHLIHNAFACGRPVITKYTDYRGKIAEPLLHPRLYINADNRSPAELASAIEKMAEDHAEICDQVHKQFERTVDFDREEQEITQFLDKLR